MTQEQKPQEKEAKEPIRVSFSLPQIAGGALAAMTAAAIGSRLGVAGTMIGAAVASIIGGIGATLYSAGIDRTHRRVSEAIYRGYERVRGGTAVAADPASPTLPGLEGMASAGTQEVTLLDFEPVTVVAPDRRRIWKVMGLSVAAMFVAALVVITVVELGTGRTLDGRDGTTITQVTRQDRATPTPKPTPSATITPTATPTVTSSPTPDPTVTPLPTPTEAATPPAPTPTADAPSTPAPSTTP